MSPALSRADGPPSNSLICQPFTPAALIKTIAAACGNANAGKLEQVAYLGSYLTTLEATTMVVESHYVDRQYIEEHAAYYARCLQPVGSHCQRLHFFSSEFNRGGLRDRLTRAASGERLVVERELQDGYLGFVVVRPLASAPIGRTVLQSFEERRTRRYPHDVPYKVHLCGIELVVEGIAFQQQDQAVAACATTALWTALQRACRHEGLRAPTTSEITAEAVRHSSPDGRAFPSDGLRAEQMMDALRAFQFPPALLHVDDSPRFFLMQMHAYLRSGIPVVLFIETKGEAHAVTALGYQTNAAIKETCAIEGPVGGAVDVAMRNLQCRQIYVHDDRMGPYARAKLMPSPGHGRFEVEERSRHKGADRRPYLSMDLEWPLRDPESTAVLLAIVPLYPKLRTCAEELMHSSLRFTSFFEEIRGEEPGQLGLEVFFDRAGSYQASLYDDAVDAAALAELQTKLALSRYVGVSRWYAGRDELADVIWDTTDRIRKDSYLRSILGLVPRSARFAGLVRDLAKQMAVPSA